jgi:hypothetical protein
MAKSSGSGRGVFGSGVFGFFGTTIHCDATDTSIYCTIMKIFNIIIVFLIVSYFLYFAYMYFMPSSFKFRNGSRR